MSGPAGSLGGYLTAAFNARPFGMAIPPNWLGLAAFGLLGAFVSPGFWLIGLGVEAGYLWLLARNKRFRAIVDSGGLDGAARSASAEWQTTYDNLLARLDGSAARAQTSMEEQGAELVQVLTRQGANATQLADVRQLVWLHLQLLVARSSLVDVAQAAQRDRQSLADQQKHLESRIADGELADDLRRSLEQQLGVIQSRRAAHADAATRLELVDAELSRLRQQIALVREQALLATDEGSVARSVDALSASLNEANRWLKDQRELFSGIDSFSEDPPPVDLLRTKPQRVNVRKRRESE